MRCCGQSDWFKGLKYYTLFLFLSILLTKYHFCYFPSKNSENNKNDIFRVGFRTSRERCLATQLIMADSKLSVRNSNTERQFKTISKQERDNILEQKDPINTKKSTKLWMGCFREYLTQKQLSQPEAIEVVDLPEILETFYSEVQKKGRNKNKENVEEEESYKNTTLRTMRAAIARFYRETRSLDIISNENFIRANAVFTGIQKITKRRVLA